MSSFKLPFSYYPDFSKYFVLLGRLAIISLLTFVVSFGARVAGLMLLDISWQEVSASDLVSLVIHGLRFDIAAILRLLLLFVLFSAVSLCLPNIIQTYTRRLALLVGAMLLIVLPVFDIGNLAYMSFFKVPYDEFVIEALFFDWAVIGAGITGAGFATVLLLAGVFSVVLFVAFSFAFIRRFQWQPVIANKLVAVLFVFVLMLIVVLLARGTLGAFPLEQRNSAVTDNHEINKLVFNGVFSFYNAWDNFSRSAEILPADEVEGREAFQVFYGKAAAADSLYEQFFAQTEENLVLESNPPHVFLGIVESLSTSLLYESYTGSPELAGRLMQHLDKDLWFSRFTPAHNFTQGSIANMLTSLNYPTISQTRHKSYSLDTSVAKIYQNKGYKTVYIYSGFESVRDGANYYLRQGFDEFVGANALLKDYPDMPLNVWGGEDWYAFDYAKKLMKESTEPLFIVMHTLTNHPPYAAPSLPWLEKELTINDQMLKVNGSLPEEALRTYHYTTEVLSDFLDYVKHGELANNTVVALTGDHGQRGALSTSKTDLYTKAVPFYLYIPEYLKPKRTVDTNALGSHRDIMPTLINLTLSDARYPNVGNNLLKIRNEKEEFAILHGHTLTNEGFVYPNQATKVRSYTNKNSLIYAEKASLKDQLAYDKSQGYLAVIDWLKRYQLQNKDLIVK